jgi:general secretion pathway protein G
MSFTQFRMTFDHACDKNTSSSGNALGLRCGARSGYSLLEVLIAVTIIALLAALIAPRLFGQLDASQVTAARTQIRMIETALDTFRLDIGRYPAPEEGLVALVTPPPDLVDRWAGPYLDGGLPSDPWGNSFQYRSEELLSRRGIAFSYGADGQPGGEGTGADIFSKGAGSDGASAPES